MKQFCLLLLRRDDEILLAMKKRGFGAGRWNGAGGKVEPNETLEQAVVRECQEEVGVTPLAYEHVATHDFLFPSGQDMQVHTFMSLKWQGEPVETEEMRPQWFKLSDIPYNDMWQDDRLWLPFVLQGKHLRTRFTFDEHENICAAEIEMVSFPAAKDGDK